MTLEERLKAAIRPNDGAAPTLDALFADASAADVQADLAELARGKAMRLSFRDIGAEDEAAAKKAA